MTGALQVTVHHLDRDATVACPWMIDFVFLFGIKIAWDEIMIIKPRIVFGKWGGNSNSISKDQIPRGLIAHCSSMRQEVPIKLDQEVWSLAVQPRLIPSKLPIRNGPIFTMC